jgi:hypothetical protein
VLDEEALEFAGAENGVTSRGGKLEGGHQRGRRDVPGRIVDLFQVQLDSLG